MIHRLRSRAWMAPLLAFALAMPVATAHTATTGPAGPKPGQYLKYRQSVFQVMGWNMGPMAAVIKGQAPYDSARFAMQATRLAALAPMFVEGFDPSTRGIKGSEAKDEIYANLEEFKRLAKDLETQSALLSRVAQSGDLAQITPAFLAVGKACGTCHKRFKAEDHH